jgi:hypothetical protein
MRLSSPGNFEESLTAMMGYKVFGTAVFGEEAVEMAECIPRKKYSVVEEFLQCSPHLP